MKKFLSNPGFEFIFAFGLIVILGLPPVLMAQTIQTKKDLDIRINNGDTIVNGRNIRQLSPSERREALNDIKHINGGNDNVQTFSFRRRGNNEGTITVRIDSERRINRFGFRGRRGNVPPVRTENITITTDSAGDVNEVRKGRPREGDRLRGPEIDIPAPGERGFRPLRSIADRFNRRNTQSYTYVNTDKDGIATRVTFHVSEASNDDLKRMPYVEGGKFEVEDLNIVPEFTSGKTLMMFSLPSKTVAEVKLHDSEGRLLWTEKALNGNFSKTFAMGLNGVYYLQIKQGNNIALRRIMKEE